MNDQVKITEMPSDYGFEAPSLLNQKPAIKEEVMDFDMPIREENKEVVSGNESKQFAPKVMIYGCGGFGVNIVRKLPSAFQCFSNINYRIFDTSMANVHKQPISEDIEVIMVGEDGKGKLRGTDLDLLAQKVDQLVYTDTVESDIDIIICSLSGGTGSVVGPLLARSIVKQDKPVIVFCVADGASVTDCVNTINTIKTLENFGKEGYINMVLFDNMVQGFGAVDNAIAAKLIYFLSAINLNNVKWLDKSDIATAMKPYNHKLLSNTRGLFNTRIKAVDQNSKCCFDDYQVPYCHSSIFVGSEGEDVTSDIMSTVSYHGKWVENQRSKITIQFGLPIPDTFNKAYDEMLKKGQAAASTQVNQSTIKVPEKTEQHTTGIIF